MEVTHSNGCTSVSDPFVFTESIPDQPSGIEVFPNPNSSILQIRPRIPIGRPVEIQLLNSLGQIVKEYEFKALSEQVSLNLTDLVSGSFFLRLRSKSGILTERTGSWSFLSPFSLA